MKNKNFISIVISLVIGLLIGGGIIGLLWQSNIKTPKLLTINEGKAYHNSDPIPGHFWKIHLSKSIYDIMKQVLDNNSSLKGCRLFPLPSENSVCIGGILSDGTDDSSTPCLNAPLESVQPNYGRISLFRKQYDAMTRLLEVNDKFVKFRLTPGINAGDGTEYIVIGGINAAGIYDSVNVLFTRVEPCPPNCDCNKDM
jgi:hypothetical protein